MTQPRHLYIVTGHSRGLGAALAAHWLATPGATVLGLSRGKGGALRGRDGLVEWSADLAAPEPVAARLGAWLGEQAGASFATATLVNNAALITSPGPLDGVGGAELAAVVRVGLEAPLLLMAAFLRATRDWAGTRRVVNISSGLGRRAMAGAAPYCAIKAGLDHASRAVALEQEALGARGARIVSLAPGIIDTDMQVQLRSADPAGFPEHERFAQFHAQGQLQGAADTAARIARFVERPDFGRDPIGDIRDQA